MLAILAMLAPKKGLRVAPGGSARRLRLQAASAPFPSAPRGSDAERMVGTKEWTSGRSN